MNEHLMCQGKEGGLCLYCGARDTDAGFTSTCPGDARRQATVKRLSAPARQAEAVQARTPQPERSEVTATCATCQHYRPSPTQTSGQCNEIGSPHGNHLAYLTLSTLTSSPQAGTDPLPTLILSPRFGCVLHQPKDGQK